jgi:type I restriction enzyme S subunit
MSSLPESWVVTNFGEVAKVRNGYAFKSVDFLSAGIPLVRQSNLSGNTVDLNKCVYLSIEFFEKYKNFQIKKGDLLIGMSGSVGKLCKYDNDLNALQNQRTGLVNIINTDYLCKSYFWNYLKTLEKQLLEKAKGVAVANVSASDIENSVFPCPPLAEQRRIADKLDTILIRVDALNTRLARITPLLKRFRQSVLIAATSGRLTEKVQVAGDSFFPVVLTESQQKNIPNTWCWKFLTELSRLESGHTPRKSIPEYWDDGDVPWISLQDIRAADGLVISETKLRPTPLGIENSSARLLPAGTVCFCRDISFGYVTMMGREMATSQHFVNWVCREGLNPKYLMYALMTSRDFLAMSGQGTTVTTIYMPALKGLRIAVPPLEEQTEIVRRVEILFAYADRLEARLQTARTAAERLTPALLAKAFRGELVPQDPNDEPATELLRRLREARAAQAPAKKTRGRKASVA